MRNTDELISNARKILQERGKSDGMSTEIFNACCSWGVTQGDCLAFRDEEVCIVGSEQDLSLSITIYGPKQTAGKLGNPAVMVDSNGRCYRYHGEVWSFIDHIKSLLL